MLLELLLATSLGQADLVAAATASGRPAECLPRARSVWAAARRPRLSSYCNALARAHARLSADVLGARAAALEASEALPDHAAPYVMLARTALALNELPAASQAFDKALALDARSVEQPLAMHALAQVQARTGRLPQALATYRVLVPRSSLLPGRERRARVLLEATHVSMAVAGGSPAPGPAALAEALAYLHEAAQDPNHALRLDIELSLVLVLDRAGKHEQADAILRETSAGARWDERRDRDYLVSPHDAVALRALALAHHDPAGAAAAWRAFLAGPGGETPWGKAAAERLSRLERAPAPRRAR